MNSDKTYPSLFMYDLIFQPSKRDHVHRLVQRSESEASLQYVQNLPPYENKLLARPKTTPHTCVSEHWSFLFKERKEIVSLKSVVTPCMIDMQCNAWSIPTVGTSLCCCSSILFLVTAAAAPLLSSRGHGKRSCLWCWFQRLTDTNNRHLPYSLFVQNYFPCWYGYWLLFINLHWHLIFFFCNFGCCCCFY